MPTPVPPQHQAAARNREFQARLRAAEQSPQLAPAVPYPFTRRVGSRISDQGRVSTSAAAFGDDARVWRAHLEQLSRTGLRVLAVPWTTDDDTVGELRLTVDHPDGTTSTDVVNLPAASSGSASFAWAHGAAPWVGAADVHVEARVVTGGGSIHVAQPSGALQTDPRGAAEDGAGTTSLTGDDRTNTTLDGVDVVGLRDLLDLTIQRLDELFELHYALQEDFDQYVVATDGRLTTIEGRLTAGGL